MNRRLAMSLILGGTLAVSARLARAQEAPPPPPPGEIRHGGPGGDMMAPPMGDRVELLGFEGMHSGKVVTGAPFSGVAVTESTQTLADGNHIKRKTQSNVFRDSQGRVRKEVTLSGFGPLAASGEPKSFVVINDPVANTNFVLHTDTKVAEQMSHPRGAMKGLAKRGAFEEKWRAREQEEIASGNLKNEDLGTKVVGGVSAQGTRLTRTIPAGQIGNEKPSHEQAEQSLGRRNDLHTDKHSAGGAGGGAVCSARGLHSETRRPGKTRDGQIQARSASDASARGKLSRDRRSSLLKTVRPFRSCPPSLREGRRRFTGSKGCKGGSEVEDLVCGAKSQSVRSALGMGLIRKSLRDRGVRRCGGLPGWR